MKRISLPLRGHPVKLRVVRRSDRGRLGVRQLVVLRGVADDVARVARRTFEKLDGLGVVSDVTLVVVPAPAVEGRPGEFAFGVTARHPAFRGVAIAVAGRNPGPAKERRAFLSLEGLPHVIAHEWAHAEQWQTRGMWSERGIEVRARNLLRGLQ